MHQKILPLAWGTVVALGVSTGCGGAAEPASDSLRSAPAEGHDAKASAPAEGHDAKASAPAEGHDAKASAPAEGHDWSQLDASIEESLDRLRALEIVKVGDLALVLPQEARCSYVLPCPRPGQEEPYYEERARQAPRLARLTAIAEHVSEMETLTPRPVNEAKQAIQALTGLEVIEVYGLVEKKPANNPQCYNLPCPEEVQAAELENERRVAKVFAIVEQAKLAGL